MKNRSFQHDQHDAGGIVAALREARANPGSVARFEVADHPTRGTTVHATVGVGFAVDGPDGRPSWRFVGEDGRLDGAGSYALIPTWYDDQSIEQAAAALAIAIPRPAGACIFRVHEAAQQVAA